jgi:murein DD-endopeptidase MepM/ murein hydrolase activator NlpD
MIRPVAIVATAGLATAALVATAVPSYAAGSVTGTVSSGKTRLTLRAEATSLSAPLGTVRNGTKVVIVCQVVGPKVKGRVRTTDRWDRLANGSYVSDSYVRRPRTVALCPPPPPPPAPITDGSDTVALPPPGIAVPGAGIVVPGSWVQPVPGKGSSGFRTLARPEHDGVDLMAARFTPIRAAAAGTVVTVVCNTNGLTCDVDGGLDTRGCGWYVEILHANNVITRYCHMVRQPEVTVGQQVEVGQVIGYVGTSGHSSGPHLHFEVHLGTPPATRANAVDPAEFMRQMGVPIT